MKWFQVFGTFLLSGALVAQAEDPGRMVRTKDLQELSFKTLNGESILGPGNIEIPGSGEYRRWVNVRDYGAVGDGDTDDLEAFRLAKAEVEKSGKPLYLPKGTYLVSETLALTAGMRLTGDLGATLRSPADAAVTVTGPDTVVENITVEATKGDAIRIDAAGFASVRGVTVKNAAENAIAVTRSTGVRIVGTQVDKAGAAGVLLDENCIGAVLRDGRVTSCADGILFGAGATGTRIEGYQVESCTRGISGYGWHEGAVNANTVIAGNAICACTEHGVLLSGGERLSFTGNVFRNFTGNAVPLEVVGEAEHPLRNAFIADSTFGTFLDAYANTRGAIVVSGAEKLTIRGNLLRPDTIKQKRITGAGTVDIVVANSKNVSVKANVIEGAIDVSIGNTDVVAEGNLTVP